MRRWIRCRHYRCCEGPNLHYVCRGADAMFLVSFRNSLLTCNLSLNVRSVIFAQTPFAHLYAVLTRENTSSCVQRPFVSNYMVQLFW